MSKWITKDSPDSPRDDSHKPSDIVLPHPSRLIDGIDDSSEKAGSAKPLHFTMDHPSGKSYELDLESPLVVVKLPKPGTAYQRGSLVYPVTEIGKKDPPAGGRTNVINPDAASAGPWMVELGLGAVPLRDLLVVSGKSLDIHSTVDGFTRSGVGLERGQALNELLDHYQTMRLPEEVRNSARLSRATGIECSENMRGIIFDSLEDLAIGLKAFEGGQISGSRRAEDKLHRDMWQSEHPGLGVDDPLIHRRSPAASILREAIKAVEQGGGSFADQLISDINASGGDYCTVDDWGGMGTPFFKLRVKVDEIDGRYVLELGGQFFREQQEVELAESLGRERAVAFLYSRHQLAPVKEGWVGVDVDEALGGGSFTPGQVDELTRMAAGESPAHHGLPVEIEGMPLRFKFGLWQEGNPNDTIRTRGNKIYLKNEGAGTPCLLSSMEPIEDARLTDPGKIAEFKRIMDELSGQIQKNLA